MESVSDLSQSVTTACAFLRKIYHDINAMLVELDRQMAERGWVSVEPSRLTYKLSSKLGFPDNWLMDYMFRFYVPENERTEFRTSTSYVVWMDGLEYAAVLSVRAWYPAPSTWAQILKTWNDSGPTMLALMKTVGPRFLKASEFQSYLPSADRLFGALWRLTEIGDQHAVTSKLIEPLVKVEQAP